MAHTDINSEDRLVQATFAQHLEKVLGWETVYAWNDETFGPEGTLGRADAREVVLTRDLRAAVARLNPELPASAVEEAVATLTRTDFTRSLLQHNQECYKFIRDGVPVKYRDAKGRKAPAHKERWLLEATLRGRPRPASRCGSVADGLAAEDAENAEVGHRAAPQG